ncbi:MAG: hypothetical protein CL974_02500, partial [Euryarchaeota archaeon]|nr:hypothetical protein [Euryarchaeota archaeon]
PPGLDIQPPPLPPGLDIQPPPLPPALDIQSPPLPPDQDIQETSQSSEVISHESISETLKSEEKSLSDKLAVFDILENEDISKDTEQISHDDATSDSVSINHLRPSTEVDSIPGDKLHAILSEKEVSLVNPDGSSLKQTIDGELIIKNPSKKHRAWDIEVELSNTASTDLGGKTVTVRELEATEVTTIPYSSNGPRMINIREIIDTESEREQEASLSLVFSDNPQEVLIMIEIDNISNVSLTDVTLTRNFPSNFQIPNSPEYSIEENTVIWEIGRMSVGENRKLSILANVLINSVEKIPAGSSEVNYKAESTVSRISFENVSSSGRQFSYVNAIEDDRPGVWHCKCVFENKSSFVVSLSGASVRLVGRESPILGLSDLRQDIPPEGSWESMEKRIESDDQPSFTQEVRYSILPRVSVQSSGSITISEQNLSILDAQILKRFDISRIKSYVSSDLEATITIENTGSATINVMRIIDDIPGIFIPPSLEKVHVEIEGLELSDDQYRIEVINGNQIEEKLISPDNPGHALRITVGTSSRLGLKPGKTLIIRYPLNAPDPSPKNELLAAPIRSDFSMERFGPVATRTVERPPVIRVVHRRRKISTGKEVFPGGGAGRYEILLMFHNTSDSALDDLALHDVVPGTFSIENSSIKSSVSGEKDSSFTKESSRDGNKVTWAIGRIEINERVEVLYEIQGDTESEYKVSDAQDFHGATFGKEVDDEPNVPEWADKVSQPNLISIPISNQAKEIVDSENNFIEQSVQKELEIDSKDSLPENNIEEISGNQNLCPICMSECDKGASICLVCGYSFK